MKGGTDKYMKTKKTQQEIIVTVLLVLIAIAAVILISNFVINMVKDRAGAGESQVKCIDMTFTINSAVNTGENVTVTRDGGGDGVEIIGAILKVDGQIQNDTIPGNWSTFETRVIDLKGSEKLTTGEKVVLAVLLKGGATCDPEAEKTVTAA